MEDFKIVVAVVLAIFSVATAVPEYHRVEAHYGSDITAYEDIMIDEDEQYVVVTVSKLTSRKVSPSINLHDFSTGYSAIKNVGEGTCYIEKTRHTMNQMKAEIDRAEKDNGYYEIHQWFTCTSKKFVEKSQMSALYGERLAAFCEDYESIFTERTYTKRSRRSFYIDESALMCIFCAGICL